MNLIIGGLCALLLFIGFVGYAACRLSGACERRRERELLELLRRRECVEGDESER
jgi:hypothetical protein